MKRFILFILILQGLLCHAMTYTGYSRGGEYRRIGYTTSYSNGQFNSSYYKVTGTRNYYSGYENSTPDITGSGSHKGPRRSPKVPTVTDYDSINGPTFSGGNTYDGRNKWYESMYFYLFGGSGESYADYNTYVKNPSSFWSQVDWSNPANQNNLYLQDLWVNDHPNERTHPWDPYMDPIGEPIVPSVLLAIGYFGYKAKTKRFRVVKEE